MFPTNISWLCTCLSARASKEVKTFDVNTMHKHGHREEDRMPDNARGTVQIWRVEDYELVDWPRNRYGIFFQGDSYVILYTYRKGNQEHYIIYFWLVSLLYFMHCFKRSLRGSEYSPEHVGASPGIL